MQVKVQSSFKKSSNLYTEAKAITGKRMKPKLVTPKVGQRIQAGKVIKIKFWANFLSSIVYWLLYLSSVGRFLPFFCT